MDTPQLITIHGTHKFRLSHVAGPAHAETGPIPDTLAGAHSTQTYRWTRRLQRHPDESENAYNARSHTAAGAAAAHERGLDDHVQHRSKACCCVHP